MRLFILVVSALALSFGIFSMPSFAVGFGPGPLPGDGDVPIIPAPPATGAPTEICYGSVCVPVQYIALGKIIIARSTLENGYEMVGWSGPCDQDTLAECPSLSRQAFNDLWVNLVNATRAQRYE